MPTPRTPRNPARPTVAVRATTLRHVVALLRAAEDEWATSARYALDEDAAMLLRRARHARRLVAALARSAPAKSA